MHIVVKFEIKFVKRSTVVMIFSWSVQIIHTFWPNTSCLLTCQTINCQIIQIVIQTMPTG